MECSVCYNTGADNVGVFPCLHGFCSDCCLRLQDKKCPICRQEFDNIDYYPAETFAQLPSENEGSLTTFQVLFSSTVQPTYEMVRDILIKKWTNKADYNHTDVCGVCMIRQRYPSIDITLLNLFFSCATLTQATVLDAMISLYLIWVSYIC